MASKSKKRVVKYRRRHTLNIGIIIFALVFIYILFYVGSYFARDKVSIYEVVEGKSAVMSNRSYTGFAMRTETVVGAENSGYVNFYVKNGSRVSKTTTVYTLDESGTLAQLLENASSEDTENLSAENQTQINYEIGQFVNRFNETDFSNVYDFKYDLNSLLLECININRLNSLNASMGESGNVFQLKGSPYSGVVEFYTDGYEGTTIENISDDIFDEKKYTKSGISSGDLVENGSPLFKVISSEDWSILIQLDKDDVQKYSENEYVNVRFLKDNLKTTAGLEILNIGDKYYGKLTFKRFMIRYADYRYLDIQIIGNNVEGLKVPKTAIAEKDFMTIPIEYLVKGGDSNETGFNKKVYNESGESSIEFVTPAIYMKDDTYCYIDNDTLKNGDIIENTNTASADGTYPEYQVGSTTGKLKGVYNVNTGYTEFRSVSILGESNDYYIIESGTNYGVQIYDHIVLDASLVKDKQIVFQ